jgi:ribosome-binding ATPase
VRAHHDENVIHPDGRVDPAADIETIETELIYADLEQAERRHARVIRDARSGDRAAVAEEAWLRQVIEALQAGRTVRTIPVPDDAPDAMRNLSPLTGKPVLYVANVDESQLQHLDSDPLVRKIAALAEKEGAAWVPICSKIEAEIQQLPSEERADFLAHAGLDEPGLNKLVRKGFDLLGLCSYFTVGEDECRAWVIKNGTRAPQAAGVIHTDFERGFIKAEVIRWDELLRHGSESAARAKGALRIEGKDYVVQDGDVIHFLFNV